MSRKKARIGQMQVLFQMEVHKDFSIESLDVFLDNFERKLDSKDSSIDDLKINLEEEVLESPENESEDEENKVLFDRKLSEADEKVIKKFDDFKGFNKEEINYIAQTIPELLQNLDKIDELISNNLEGWSLNRLAKVDKEIIRIAIYEFLFRDDIPGEVSINEAIEIAKNYGSKDSSKFVNGILGAIYRELEK